MPVRSFTALARTAAAVAALVVALSACQDPSGVGLGLIGENGNTPTGAVVAADSVRLVESDLQVTGGYGGGVSSSRSQARMLVGHVDDPLVGNATAAAYFDLVPPSTIPSNYREHTITGATLRFNRDYIYGDSTSSFTVELRGVSADWDPLVLTSDTALAVGDVIATYTVAATDTLVQLALPQAWVTANADLLQDVDFAEDFDGFRLSLAEGQTGGAVVGLSTANVATRSGFLRVTTAQETVDYPIAETYTSVDWETDPAPPVDRVLLRSADDQALAFTFDYDALADLALAGGALRLNLDRDLYSGAGSFARPLPTTVGLYGIVASDDSTRVLLSSASVAASSDVVTFASSTLTAILQRASLGTRTYARFEISLAISPVTIGALPLVLGPAAANPLEDRRPRLTLTVIPTAP